MTAEEQPTDNLNRSEYLRLEVEHRTELERPWRRPDREPDPRHYPGAPAGWRPGGIRPIALIEWLDLDHGRADQLSFDYEIRVYGQPVKKDGTDNLARGRTQITVAGPEAVHEDVRHLLLGRHGMLTLLAARLPAELKPLLAEPPIHPALAAIFADLDAADDDD